MRSLQTLEQLWNSPATSPPRQNFHLDQLTWLPFGTRRYLTHAIAPGTALASRVRLRMHGEIKLKGWRKFVAEQVIAWDRGMIWQAKTQIYGLSISGSDRILDGQGAMQWKLLGILPFMNAAGPDITRSAAGRLNIESLWLPSVLSGPEVEWTATDQTHIHARFAAHTETANIDYLVSEGGELKTVSMLRWGKTDSEPFRYIPFGGVVEESCTFGGYTVPTRVRVG